tara:strand:+ start:3095 stop:4132 length:1038 start_codon:yes stop_codon:yes gene_type:complete
MLNAVKFTVAPLSLAFFAYLSFTQRGVLTYSAFLYAYAMIPMIEFALKNDERNLSKFEESLAKKNIAYDLVLYVSVALHMVLLSLFLFSLEDGTLQMYEVVGRVLSMGLVTTFAINLAHELGHRQTWREQFLSKLMLLTTLMMHFFIEHNRGHHKNVATFEDPSTARKGETVYAFWFRAILNEYLSAWRLEKKRLDVIKQSNLSLQNEMVQFQIIQFLFVGLIYYLFGGFILLAFLFNAAIAYVSFETVQYLEHYGLQRKKNEKGRHERVKAHHSWNSNHVFGRLMMFNLSRHSDHHFKAHKKYQVLNHHDDAPQLPTGYPGMMILSLIPPLWFRVMNPKLEAHK